MPPAPVSHAGHSARSSSPQNKSEKGSRPRSHQHHESSSRQLDGGSAGAAQAGTGTRSAFHTTAGNLALQRLLHTGVIQAKLEVGSSNDPLEREADHAAEEALGGAAGACSCGGDCARCRSAPGGMIQRQEAGGDTSGAPPRVDDDFLAGLGHGQPLDDDTRVLLEPRFGRDLGRVRIHTGPAADQAASLLHAKAFTAAPDIVFAAGLYAPQTEAGRRLIAHEVAHVVQQEREGLPRVIRRVGAEDPPFGYFPAEREILDRERERKRAQELRHQQWAQSHREHHAAFLATQGTTLAEDIANTKSQIIAQRVAMIQEAVRRNATPAPAPAGPPPFPGTRPMGGSFPTLASITVPEDLAQKWATAQQEVVLVETLLQGNQFTPEDGADASAMFAAFYRTLLPLAESRDKAERELEEFDASFAAIRPPPPPCPDCHAPTPPSDRERFKAPPPRGPALHAALDQALAAKSDAAWPEILKSFGTATAVMDRIVLDLLPEKNTARQGFTYSQELLARQEELQRTAPDAIKIPAVFYPKDAFISPEGEKGEKVEIASGIPWYFYLTHTASEHGEYKSGFSWTLRDITSPKRPQVTYELSDPERFTRSYAHLGVDEPPPALFKLLNDELVFPEGMLYWTYPNGKIGSLETTEPWSISTWLTAIGIGLAGLAVILGTGGLASGPVLTALALGGAAAGVASTLADLQHRSDLGILTEEDKEKAILFIAADLASILTLGLGHAAEGAARAASAAGRATRLTFIVQRAATASAAVEKALGAVTMITVALDFVDQYQAIQNSNLPAADKEAALRRLALTGLLTGALIVVPHAVAAGRGPHEAPGGAHPGAGEPGGSIVVKSSGAEPSAGWSRPPAETEFLTWSRKQEVLPPEHASHELQIAEREGTKRAVPDDPEFSRDIELHEHHWKEKRDGTGWCRLSTRRCYRKDQLRVGARGEAERVSVMNSLDEIAKFRRTELARQPAALTTAQARLDWADYSFYANRRLRMIEEDLAAGRTPHDPPRTFESFRTAYPPGHVIRNEIQGSRFEQRAAKEFADVFKEAGSPEHAVVVLQQPHISESTTPGREAGELTRPDFLIPLPNGHAIGVSNKSRGSFLGMKEPQVRAQVRLDLEELVEKYSHEHFVRREPGARPVDVNELWLLYDAAMVPPRFNAVIKDEVAKFARVYRDTTLKFGVRIF